MRKAAEAAETGQFNPAIDAADGAEGLFECLPLLRLITHFLQPMLSKTEK